MIRKFTSLLFTILFLKFMQAGTPLPSVTAYHEGIQFLENKNQWDAHVLYRASVPGAYVFLEKNSFTYFLYSREDLNAIHEAMHERGLNFHASDYTVRGFVFKMHLDGANPFPVVTASDPAPGYYNFLLGNDPSKWAGHVAGYAAVHYENIYEGIGLNVYSANNQLKYDFEVAPNANASQIELSYEGAENLGIEKGNLVIHTSLHNVMEQKPVAYQIIDGKKVYVTCRFVLKNDKIGFSFPRGYNKKFPLTIDPVVVAATYSGSTSDNYGHCATYDADGNIYIAGRSFGPGWPTTVGAFQTAFSGFVDIGINKYNPDGSSRLWATYLGGTSDEYGQSLFVTSNFELCVYGSSASNNYPTSATAFDNSANGSYDIIVTKLASDGASLVGSTYIGGAGNDGFNNIYHFYGDSYRGEILGDVNGNMFIASCTQSNNFPTTAGCYDNSYNGGEDACVIKVNGDCSGLIWSTYLGGTQDDAAFGIRYDSNGNIFVDGGTSNNTFPATAGVLHPTYQGGTNDGFIAELSSTGSSLMRSTFIGTTQYDECFFIDLDALDNVYVYGASDGNIPITAGVYSQAGGGNFVQELTPNLTSLTISTILGPSSAISPTAFLVDVCDNMYIAGWGTTTGLPVSSNAVQPTTDGSDFYLCVMTPNASTLLYATFFGDPAAWEHVDGGTSRFDKQGIVYEAVCAGGTNFPTNSNAWSPNNQSGSWDCAVFKIDFETLNVSASADVLPDDTVCLNTQVTFVNNSNGDHSTWDFGDGSAIDTATAPSHLYINAGVFTVTMVSIDSNSCMVGTDTTYLTITVLNPSIVASFDTTIITACDSLPIIFTNTSTGGIFYSWNFGDGGTSAIQNPSHTYFTPGTYQVTLVITDTFSCNVNDTASMFITMLPFAVSDIGLDSSQGCAPVTIDFPNLSSAGTYHWDFGTGDTSNLANPTYTFPLPGTYTVTLITTDLNSCNIGDTDVAIITVSGYPTALWSSLDTVRVYDPVYFTDLSTGAANWLWQFGDGGTSTETNPAHIYNALGDFTVCEKVENTALCPDTFCQKITVVAGPYIYIPNAFTPNGDGINDILSAITNEVVKMDLKIFNRWGIMMFETTDVDSGWDGTYKGKNEEMDVYAYYVTASFLDGTSTSKKGNITLIR